MLPSSCTQADFNSPNLSYKVLKSTSPHPITLALLYLYLNIHLFFSRRFKIESYIQFVSCFHRMSFDSLLGTDFVARTLGTWTSVSVLFCAMYTAILISPLSDKEGNKLQRQKTLIFIYPIYNHNWRNISTIYIYITRLASKEIFSPSKKIHREVGWAKDLSAPL